MSDVGSPPSLDGLPGAEIVRPGLADLRDGRDTIEGNAVLMAATRLRLAGLPVPEGDGAGAGHRLYVLLDESDPVGAYSRYNAIIRRIVSFARSVEADARRR